MSLLLPPLPLLAPGSLGVPAVTRARLDVSSTFFKDGASESSGGLTSYATGGITMETSSLIAPRVFSCTLRQSFVSGRCRRTSSIFARVGLAPIFSRYRHVYSLKSALCSASSSTVSMDGSRGTSTVKMDLLSCRRTTRSALCVCCFLLPRVDDDVIAVFPVFIDLIIIDDDVLLLLLPSVRPVRHTASSRIPSLHTHTLVSTHRRGDFQRRTVCVVSDIYLLVYIYIYICRR